MVTTTTRKGRPVTEGQSLRVYAPGDTIEMTIEMQHQMHVNAVHAIFQHVNDDQAIMILEDSQEGYHEPLGGMEKRTEWRPEGIVPVTQVSGEYELHTIELRTAADNTIMVPTKSHLADRPPEDLRFQVIEEPTGKPTFTTVALN